MVSGRASWKQETDPPLPCESGGFLGNLLIYHRFYGYGPARTEAFRNILFLSFRTYAILWRFSLKAAYRLRKESHGWFRR